MMVLTALMKGGKTILTGLDKGSIINQAINPDEFVLILKKRKKSPANTIAGDS